MNPNEYQEFTRSTAVYGGADTTKLESLMYLALGLNGEAGEVAEVVKKAFRDGYELEVLRERIMQEGGDVLWYLARLADVLDIPMTSLFSANMLKLQSRKDRGRLHGSGDDR